MCWPRSSGGGWQLGTSHSEQRMSHEAWGKQGGRPNPIIHSCCRMQTHVPGSAGCLPICFMKVKLYSVPLIFMWRGRIAPTIYSFPNKQCKWQKLGPMAFAGHVELCSRGVEYHLLSSLGRVCRIDFVSTYSWLRSSALSEHGLHSSTGEMRA